MVAKMIWNCGYKFDSRLSQNKEASLKLIQVNDNKDSAGKLGFNPIKKENK